MLLTSLAWSLAYTYKLDSTIPHLFSFIFVHFIGSSLLVATGSFFFVGRLLGPGVPGLPGRRRAQGLFRQANEDGKEQVEFGYCFDVSQKKPCLPNLSRLLFSSKQFSKDLKADS
jgi:hypothetical protein